MKSSSLIFFTEAHRRIIDSDSFATQLFMSYAHYSVSRFTLQISNSQVSPFERPVSQKLTDLRSQNIQSHRLQHFLKI